MRRLLLALVLLAAPASAAPQRVVSTDICADQLVLMLADRGQIASLSSLSRDDPALSNFAEAAQGLPVNRRGLEEILPLKPDLVIADAFAGARLKQRLESFGVRVETLTPPDSFAGIAAQVRQVGSWLGQSARAEDAVAAMEAALVRPAAPLRPVRTLVYRPGGTTTSGETLTLAVLEAAGLANAAAALGAGRGGAVPLEALIAQPPELLVLDDYRDGGPSQAQRVLRHPALARLEGLRIVRFPSRLWLCPGPWTAQAVTFLRDAAAPVRRLDSANGLP